MLCSPCTGQGGNNGARCSPCRAHRGPCPLSCTWQWGGPVSCSFSRQYLTHKIGVMPRNFPTQGVLCKSWTPRGGQQPQHGAVLQHLPRLKRSGRCELPASPSGHQPHCGALVLHSFSQRNWMVLHGLSTRGRSWHRQQATSLGTWLKTRGDYWRNSRPPNPCLRAQLREQTDTTHGGCASLCATALAKSPHSQS